MLPSEITAEAIIDSFPHGYFLIDKENRIVQWNGWIARKTGISKEDALGQTIDELYPDRPEVLKPLNYIWKTGQPCIWSQKLHKYYLPVELASHHISGFEFMQQDVNFMPTAGGQYISVAIRDVTSVATGERRLRTLQRELEEASSQANMANEAKSEFLANVSHELRTPLNSLLLLAQMLGDNDEGNLTDEQLESIQHIFRGGHDLLNIINDLLDLSKAEAGKLTVVKEPMKIEGLVHSIQQQFDAILARKGLYWKVDIEEAVPVSIVTDPQRLEQILRNLISNAIKFTMSGGITLKIFVPAPNTSFRRRDIEPSNLIGLSVEDTGIGIRQDRQEAIFEAFQQADGSTSRSYGGTGLGLSISRELAGLLGGEVHLKSEVDVGSCFTLFIADTQAVESVSSDGNKANEQSTRIPWSSSEAGDESVPNKDPLLQGCRVLLVDDDVKNSWALSRALTQRGLQVEYVENGEAAIDVLSKIDEGFDCIFMDIMMPIMNGFEAIKKIRLESRFDDIPIVALTADALRQTKEKCIHAGADDYLSKPFNVEQIISSLKKYKNNKIRQNVG